LLSLSGPALLPCGKEPDSPCRSIGIVACSDTSLQVLSYECECPVTFTSPNTLQNFAALRAQMPKHLDFHNVARISYAFWASPIGSVTLTTRGLATVEAASEQTGRSALLATFIATFDSCPLRLSPSEPGSGRSRDFSVRFSPALPQLHSATCATEPFQSLDHRQFTLAPSFPGSVASPG
jgi:hypothetical protein